jgi:hypothetical protein
MAKAISLLKAYQTETIPIDGGIIITSNFDEDTAYSIYEITAFAGFKDIYQGRDEFAFKTDGERTHILVEPPVYLSKSVEPAFRDADKSIPYKFNELNIIACKNLEKIMIPKEPVKLPSNFTIQNAQGTNFAYLFYFTEDVYVAIKKFIADTLYNDAYIDKTDAIDAARLTLQIIKKFTILEG